MVHGSLCRFELIVNNVAIGIILLNFLMEKKKGDFVLALRDETLWPDLY